MDEFKKLVEECKSLYETNKNASLKLYREKIFPQVKTIVETKAKKDRLIGKYSSLILTVGLTPEPLILTITALKPTKVYFLYTEKSEKFINQIVNECNLSPTQVKRDKVEKADASDVYEKIRKRWQDWKNQGGMAIDMTGGTKSMVTGCSVAAALLNIHLLYVDSVFGWLPRISKPGTEHIVLLSNPLDIFGDLEEEKAIDLFNSYDWPAAIGIIGRLISQVTDPRKFEVEKILCEAYGAWDRFEFEKALQSLKFGLSEIKRYRIKSDKIRQIQNHQEILEMLSKNQKKSFFLLLKDNLFAKTLMVDVYSNAERRASQGCYDDAIIRLYRVLELISQYRLAKYDINTSEVKVSDETTIQKFETLSERVYGTKRGLADKIALMDSWILLYAKGDVLLQGCSEQDLNTFKDALLPRNKLLIEHINSPGKKTEYKKFKKFVTSWLKKIVGDLETRMDKHKFLSLPL